MSYNVETGEVEHFDFVNQPVEIYKNIGPQFISCITYEKILKNRHCRIYGFFWFYKEDFSLKELKNRFDFMNKPNPLTGRKRPDEVGKKISESRKGIKFSEEHLKNMSLCRMGTGTKRIIRSDGIIFESIKDAAKETNCDRSSISHNLSGNTKSCKGFKFSYL